MRKQWRLSVYAIMVFVIAALIVTVIGGCTAAQKPDPKPNEPNPQVSPAPQTPTPTPVRNMPTNTDQINRISERLAADVARIPGVNSAAVVISGNTAYVGVDMDAGVEKRTTNNIKNDVVRVVKKGEPRLANVLVSTDADTVTRLKKIGDGLAQGKPMSAFDREMAEIARRMSPNTR
ncbi:YhcN/YlaJ family sporulation lipoprotein [Desulfolucanica intricata]|uniref:YhcN/YlaJ family sporulation lipoprotein n=1 Tax=Desulfolucanica intricata TaxID=1285191 RepID=UPI00082D0156|nr:YhcN/YlaJ family sporulation lipoprotein [Desulfolucanica intricata]